MSKELLAVFLLFFCISCSSVRHVLPLQKGESAVDLSVGGPITKVGNVYIPLPLLSAGYRYGITENLGLESGLGITSMLYRNFHLDAGITWHPFLAQGARPGLFLSPRLFFLANSENFRLYPDLDLGTYWKLRNNLIYTGVENWFEYHATRSDGNSQDHHWLIIPFLGYGYSFNKWQFQLEGRVYTPNLKNTGRATENIGFGDYGILGVFIGFSRSLGGGK